jgi:hypothetical protein
MTSGLEPVGIIGKALGNFKDTPLWLLIGATAFCLVFPFLPNTDKLFSGLVFGWVRIASVFFGILAFCRFGSLVIPPLSSWWTRRKRRRVQQNQSKRLYEAKKYGDFYAPMFAELIAIHITIVSGTGGPRFTDRLENAWTKFVGIKRRSAAIRAAWKALFDRLTDETGEVDYGGQFPLEKLRRIVHRGLAFADIQLVTLICVAEQARRGAQFHAGYLTTEDIKLYRYIMTEHDEPIRNLV